MLDNTRLRWRSIRPNFAFLPVFMECSPMKLTRFSLALIAAAALAGCASNVKLDDPAPVVTAGANNTAPAVPVPTSTGASESAVAKVDLSAELAASVSNARVIYFDFDSDVVKSEFQGVVEKHANRLTKDKKVSLLLEGHTDARGGREYNLALGQRRAESVAKSLGLLGVTAGQVEPVSMGKEHPAAQGSDEAAWSKNRRVELKDK
jgi:peptidoglycan-associated lipoprotein